MMIPPLLGGALVALWPGAVSASAALAGFTAAFLTVWPVLQFPYHLLERHLQPYWGKLRFIYALFVGSSTALAYLGFVAVRSLVPAIPRVTGATAWQNFLDDVAANAIYDFVKYLIISALVLGGYVVNRERKRIGMAAEAERRREEDQSREVG